MSSPQHSKGGQGSRPPAGQALRGDLAWTAALVAVAAFLFIPATHRLFVDVTAAHPYIVAFVKFAILATMGELLATRINAGAWVRRTALPARSAIWGLLGVLIVLVFEIFGSGVKSAMGKGLLPGGDSHFLFALFVSTTMNVLFAPTMMFAHRLSDTWLDLRSASRSEGGSRNPGLAEVVARIDMKGFVGFVLFRTIPLFWIPAHTLTFLLPPVYRVLAAAFLSIALGAILAFARGRTAGGHTAAKPGTTARDRAHAGTPAQSSAKPGTPARGLTHPASPASSALSASSATRSKEKRR